MADNQAWLERVQQQSSQREGDHRTPFQRDKARILHSAAFRRLQAKTQVLGVGISDFYRTRLTHSLEASQIGQGIAAQLRSKFPDLTLELGLNDTLIEALCLSHDIGHPPFGHGGEVALNYKMREQGGFEGNGQTFRIVTKLEPYTADSGMNLSRRTLLGLIKYPNYIDVLKHKKVLEPISQTLSHRQIQASQWHPPKGLYLCDSKMFDWLLAPLSAQDKSLFMSFKPTVSGHSKTQYKSFDCSIMELADDIAYGIHDLEDAIVMGIVTQSQFMQEVAEPIAALGDIWLSKNIMPLSAKLFSHEHHERKDAIGALVNSFITCIEIEDLEPAFDESLLKYNAVFPPLYQQALSVFKRYVFNRVILKPDIQLLEYKGQQIVMELFEAFSSDPIRLLPENTRQRYKSALTENNGQRVISDYISGMTDGFASRLYSSLFLPSGQAGLDKSLF
ncbi:anti-phage deoxyguanosine triphosphatase [Paraglaciecola hydrolytica]|uniref:Deoxyguanosinetriphosphate triphosphohydrolase-like protein n=1 Tax=Paraglaciecola hydrolytica TaxID=1799789 RepID=A0A136A1B4_9ALTE|nr:anti-phage deoxyguanosine triphosphatase [Paraglaciecola hydrolytica]KXI29025.1 deoxyguanosinetriphosphate triphosphohydrolase [Paraglaciecola hydrolytica]